MPLRSTPRVAMACARLKRGLKRDATNTELVEMVVKLYELGRMASQEADQLAKWLQRMYNVYIEIHEGSRRPSVFQQSLYRTQLELKQQHVAQHQGGLVFTIDRAVEKFMTEELSDEDITRENPVT